MTPLVRVAGSWMILSILACDGSSEKGSADDTSKTSETAASEKQDDSPSPAEFLKAPEGPLPPLVRVSSFEKQIGATKYPEAKGPTEPLHIRFDFSKEGIVTYDYGQSVVMKSRMGNVKKDMRQKMDGTGLLQLKSKGDKTATLVMKDFEMTVEMGVQDEKRSMKSSMPPVVAQGVKEDGTMKVGNSSAEALLNLLFPIPTRTLKPGQSDKVPATFPVNFMGSPLHAQGFSTITLTHYVKIGGRVCARLDTEIDISEVEVPEELPGKVLAGIVGKSVFYYDVEAKRFVSGALAASMSMRMESAMPKFSAPGEKSGALSGMKTRMVMDSDNHIRIKLKSEGAKDE